MQTAIDPSQPVVKKMPRVNFSGAGNLFSRFIAWIKTEKIWRLALAKFESMGVWLVVFVLSEILISGGRYEFNPFMFALNLAVIIIMFGYFNIKRPTRLMIDALKRSGLAVLVYAILDFLIINLWLEKFNLSIYKTWQTYVTYAVIILIPIAYCWLANRRKRTPEIEVPVTEV